MTAHAADDKRGLPGERPGDSAALEYAINPLQRLIKQRLRERGWSYGEVARRGGLPRSTVYTLATTRNVVPASPSIALEAGFADSAVIAVAVPSSAQLTVGAARVAAPALAA